MVGRPDGHVLGDARRPLAHHDERHAEHRDVAALLDRLELVKGWVNAWTTSVSKTDIEGTSGVQFTASVDLGSAAAINGRAK